MTDAEIMKALSLCGTGCVGCPLIGNIKCRRILSQQSLDLIERQQKRIDRIVDQLEEAAFQEDEHIYNGDAEVDSWVRLSKVIEIVKGGAE